MQAVFRDVRDGVMLVEYPGSSDEEANRAAVALGRRLREAGEDGLLDAVPGARSLLVVFDPDRLTAEVLTRSIERPGGATAADSTTRVLRVPVVYDGEDLAELASARGIPGAELARRHAAGRYRVAFVGFAPGFGYLSGLPAELATPRLTTPRPRVPAGSVAIGGPWTGIYPAALPGGWRLIGRTSVRLFDARADPPSLLVPGDRVEFESVGPGQLPAPEPPPSREPDGILFARVAAPGLATTIQGGPKYGLGSSGVPPGGATDTASLDFANALVGNRPGAPALEITLAGPELEILGDALFAVAGGEGPVECRGRAVPRRETFRAAAGDRVRIGRLTRGARAYLAVRGGVAGDPGRRLSSGDALATRTGPDRPPGPAPRLREPDLAGETVWLRVLAGPEAARLPSAEFERFLASPWSVTPESDRRGLRLSGKPLDHTSAPEIEPSGTVPGTVQVPGGGSPIVLGPDGPVTGGYPRIATVISADLPRLGQVRPGDVLRFQRISLDEARSARARAGVR